MTSRTRPGQRSARFMQARSTLEALENARLGDLGYSKITNILTALGLELTLQESRTRRPTLDDLMNEEQDDQGLDRRR